MADWTTIADTQVDPDAPVTSELGYAWRDNPIAIAEGASGAPRIVRGALSTAVNSVAGLLPPGGEVTISMNAFSFFPNVRTTSSSINVNMSPAETGVTGADNAQFQLRSDGGSSVNYSVDWRYITA